MPRSSTFAARVSAVVTCFCGMALLVAGFRLIWHEVTYRWRSAEATGRVTNLTATEYVNWRRWRSEYRHYVHYEFPDATGRLVQGKQSVSQTQRETIHVGDQFALQYLPPDPSVSRMKPTYVDITGFVAGPIFLLCGIGIGIVGVLTLVTGVDYVRRLRNSR